MPKPIEATRAKATDSAVPIDHERLLGLDFIRATEAAALSAYKWMGKGDKESADYAACDAIRGLFDSSTSPAPSRSARASRTTRRASSNPNGSACGATAR